MTSPRITAPGGFCDDATRRTSHLARGLVRGSILDLFHEFCGEHTNASPRLVSLVGFLPPTNFPCLGFGRARAFNHSQRAQSCQIVRASQHISALSNAPTSEASAWCTEVVAWSSAIGGQL